MQPGVLYKLVYTGSSAPYIHTQPTLPTLAAGNSDSKLYVGVTGARKWQALLVGSTQLTTILKPHYNISGTRMINRSTALLQTRITFVSVADCSYYTCFNVVAVTVTLQDDGTEYYVNVSNSQGSARSDTFVLKVSEGQPVLTINSPASTLTYKAGDTIQYSGKNRTPNVFLTNESCRHR